MRVISGSLRGKKIFEPKDIKTRPLKDLTKESIFNIINHSNKFKVQLMGANVLDLFSGVGSFGIECISRGASKVVFAENYDGVLPILRKNLMNIKFENNFKIIEKDIYKEETFLILDCMFDIIFLDPPYKLLNVNMLMNKIYESKILKKNNLIILHRHRKDNSISYERFNLLEEKTYGISKVIFGNYLK